MQGYGNFNFEFYPCCPKLKGRAGIPGHGRKTLDTLTFLRCPNSQVCYVIRCFFRGKIDLKTVLESPGGLLS